MRKRALWLSAAGVVAMLVAGGIFASNMGFKLNYSMLTGTNSLGLPYNAQTNITNAETLIDDIELANPGTVSSVSRFDTAANGLVTYTGTRRHQLPDHSRAKATWWRWAADIQYIVVGSHDPGHVINFATGTQIWSYPYHSTLTNAEGLIDEIELLVNPVVSSVSRFDTATNGLITYTGSAGTNFPLTPGEAYHVAVEGPVNGYVPSHY